MRLAILAFGVALAGFLLVTETELGGTVAGLTAAAMLIALGYGDGTWRALRFAALIPAAAIVADVMMLAGLSLQTGPEAHVYTYAALFFLPAWVLLVLVGVGARRLSAG
jgi:hypothetical protein